MSEIKFTAPEALTIIYKLMMDMDGKADQAEIDAILKLIKKYVDHADQDVDEVVKKAMEFYNSREPEQNFKFGVAAAGNLPVFYDHNTLVMIARDLATIAMADGDLHTNENKFWITCLNAMGVTMDDLKK